MSATVAVQVLLLGVLTLLGAAGTVLAARLVPRDSVPVCCRRRLDSFVARAPLIMLSAAVVAGAGVVLLAVDLV